ncbi:MAG: protein BatD [Candidatus Zixiibacteriota bacterium]|nr:MAG: protein BatD [candidate division Zixibacteria bacterium]
MSRVSRIFFVLLCLIPAALAAQDDISIAMSLSRDVVNLGSQVTLTITVSGPQQNLPKPELPNLSMFDYYPQGTSTNISIVNGRVEAALAYNYLLTPRREGTFVIKPAVVVYNQKRYESNDATLKVLAAGATARHDKRPQEQPDTQEGDDRPIFLTAEVNKKRAYVNEQITLRVKFYHAVQLYSQPDYTAPQTTDFWTDIIDPQKSYYEVVNGKRYKVIEINTALFPTRSGDLKIGSAMVTATVPSKRRSRRLDPFTVFDDFFVQGEKVTARSKPLSVTVRPLPAEGKPTDFSGTVGNFKISSSVDKAAVEVNQPVTVTYKITGTGNIATVAEPAIGDLKDFRIYRASSSEKVSKLNGVIGGTKIFEEAYIPKRAGKLTIPPVEFSFFDPTSGSYKVFSTRAIILNVTPAEEGEYADMPFRPVAGRVVDPNAKDIRFIKTSPGEIGLRKPLVIFRPVYLVINIIPVLVLAAVWVGSKRREKLASDLGYARSSGARKLAKKRLAAASKLARSNRATEFYAEIRLAIFSYIADKLNISPHGLTSDGLLDILKEAGSDEELERWTADLFRRADFAQYSAVDVPQHEVMQSLKLAEKILVRLEEISIA